MRLLKDQGYVERNDGLPGVGLRGNMWYPYPLRLTSPGHLFAEALSNNKAFTAVKANLIGAGLSTIKDLAGGSKSGNGKTRNLMRRVLGEKTGLFGSDSPPCVMAVQCFAVGTYQEEEDEMTNPSIQSPYISILITLSVMIGVALLCITASAQGHPGAKPSKQTINPATEKQFKFDVISIRPQPSGTVGMHFSTPSKNGFQSGTTVLRALLSIAYTTFTTSNSGLLEVRDAPKWVSQPIVVDARVAEKDLAAWQAQGSDLPLFRNAMRELLSERYKLKVHTVESQAPYWDLVIAHNGPKLQEASQTDIILPNGLERLYDGGLVEFSPKGQKYSNATIAELASMLCRDSYFQPVQDKTGLTKHYNFTLEYDDLGDSENHTTLEMVSRSLAKLGISLKQGKGPALTIVIDHIEPLIPN